MENINGIGVHRLRIPESLDNKPVNKADQTTAKVAKVTFSKTVTFAPKIQHQVSYGNKEETNYGEFILRRYFPLREPLPKPDDELHCKEGHARMEEMYHMLKAQKVMDCEDEEFIETAEQIFGYFNGREDLELSPRLKEKSQKEFTHPSTALLADIAGKSNIRYFLNSPSWNDPELDSKLNHLLILALVTNNYPSSENRDVYIKTMKDLREYNKVETMTQQEFYGLYADLYLRNQPKHVPLTYFLPHNAFYQINEELMKRRLEERLDLKFVENSYNVKYVSFPSGNEISQLVDDLIEKKQKGP